MNRIFAIIPARYASSRFRGKPLANIGGKPLIEWTYRSALKCKILEKVVVATDDERIFKQVKSFGGLVCLTSSSHLSGTDRVAEAARKMKLPGDSIVVNIQGDEPLLRPSMIRSLVKPLLDDSSLNMSTLSYRIRREQEISSGEIVKVVTDRRGYALYFSRSVIPYPGLSPRQCYFKHIGIYAYRKKFLLEFSGMKPTELEKRERLEQLRAMENGHRIKVVESRFDPVEVDVPGDIEKVLEEINRTGAKK